MTAIVELKDATVKVNNGVDTEKIILDHGNLTIREGDFITILGGNGAGKSTLMNVLSGTIPYGEYTGDIVYNGEVCQFHNIHDSEDKKIVIIQQELAMIHEMTIA